MYVPLLLQLLLVSCLVLLSFHIVNILQQQNWNISKNKVYKDYLLELSSYYFCLCPRGNAFDTHRFWESLYLGVIPVIINDKNTNMNNFISYLDILNVPYYTITDINFFSKYTIDYFNKELYIKILSKTIKSSIQTQDFLKLSYYTS